MRDKRSLGACVCTWTSAPGAMAGFAMDMPADGTQGLGAQWQIPAGVQVQGSPVQLDARSIPKQEAFSGADTDWPDWKFGFKSYAAFMGVGWILQAAEGLAESLVLDDTTPWTKTEACFLYHLLAQLCKDKSRGIARQAWEGNGFERRDIRKKNGRE